MRTKNNGDFLINSLYVIFIGILIFIAFKYLLWLILPFLIALVVGYIVQKPAIKVAEEIKIKTETAASIIAVFLYVFLGFIISIILFYMFKNLPPLIKTFSEWITAAAENLTLFFNKYIDYTKNLPEELGSVLQNLPNALADGLVASLSGTVSNTISFFAKNIPSVLFGFIITVLASAYFAHDYKIVKRFVFSFLKENQQKNVKKVKRIIFANVLKMIKGYVLLCLVTFLELGVGFLILGVKSSILLAGIIALIDALPVLGVGVVLLPWAIISILSGGVGLGVALCVIYLIITIVRNILEPKILSGNLGIPPLLSLIIIFFGLKLFGFFGMLASFISLVIIIDFYREDTL